MLVAPVTARAEDATAAPQILSETSQLNDRRFVAAGTRAYDIGTEAGRYYAMGFHTRGEMAGIWAPPLKLLDGLWFGVDGGWIGPATRFTSGMGYVQMNLPGAAGATITRTDFVPDGRRAVLVGLDVRAGAASASLQLKVDAHSELMSAYPWGGTTPNQETYNLPDKGSVSDGRLVFREIGSPAPGQSHDWASIVGPARGNSATLIETAVGPGFRGPEDPPTICPVSSSPQPQPATPCDDTGYGKGTGGELRYQVQLRAHEASRLWFVVAGSDQSLADARTEFAGAAADPDALLAAKIHSRLDLAAFTRLQLPGDPTLAQGIDWSKQNLADLRQTARNLQVRVTNAGTKYPAPVGRLPEIAFVGAGYPDYPWMFATDGEYTAFADVAVGQFQAIADHLNSLRRVSDLANAGSGKVVHEVVTTGDVYFGANNDPGNTDETVKFPSSVALVWRWTGDQDFLKSNYSFTVRNLRYVFDNLVGPDGWPQGAGNVEKPDQGAAKVDSAVYLIRGLLDEVELANAMGDGATARWAEQHADTLMGKFEKAWWDAPQAPAYADSLTEPAGVKLMQRYWTGVTPMEAELWQDGHTVPGLASPEHGAAALQLRQTQCYTGPWGLYVDGQGATTATLTPPQPTFSCDSDKAVSTSPDEKDTFTVNTAVMAVAEGDYGRLAEQRRYIDDNVRTQLQPNEMPGAMPEIAPSPPHPPYYGNSLSRLFTERAQVMQAWGNYGTVWPVVHQQLGVSPDLGRNRLEVVPNVPAYEPSVSGRNIRLGSGAADVRAAVTGGRLNVDVSLDGISPELTVGATLPAGSKARQVLLNGHDVEYQIRHTNQGDEVIVPAGHLEQAHLQVRMGGSG
ncbi:MAG: glycogen debranching protein [Candidatus Dormibacteraeota bacterium]|nr:glycogen debranching protein [Candidatus Dormibacteraeota bacterium]